MDPRVKPPIKVAFFAFECGGPRDNANLLLAETWQRVLDDVIDHISGVKDEDQRKFKPRVYGTLVDALKFLGTSESGTLVFFSESFIQNARDVSRAYPNLRVIVFTGAEPPAGEPIVIRKQWVTNETLVSMVE